MDKNKELAIKIIDKFEELLVKHNIKLPSSERENNENEACIYGADYFNLEDEITELLENNVNCYK